MLMSAEQKVFSIFHQRLAFGGIALTCCQETRCSELSWEEYIESVNEDKQNGPAM